MTSRERVLTAIARRRPDRVPLDFSANAFVLERLHRDLATATHRQLLDPCHVLQVDVPTANVLALYDADSECGGIRLD